MQRPFYEGKLTVKMEELLTAKSGAVTADHKYIYTFCQGDNQAFRKSHMYTHACIIHTHAPICSFLAFSWLLKLRSEIH